MRNLEFSPLMRSASLYSPFNQLFDELERPKNLSKELPYNILKLDADQFQIVIAAPGLTDDDIHITATQNSLSVSSELEESDQEVEYLHKGLSGAAFSQKFELAETIKVVSATMENGLLKIDLKREIPESLKPRRIQIGKPESIEDKAS
ncbi:MAG: Hsp20 family protein [Pseudomonas marincola]